MKKYIFTAVAALFFLIGCKNTNENLVERKGVSVGMSEAIPAFFIGGDVESSYVAFDLSLPEGESVDKAELEVVYGDKKAIMRSIDLPSTNMEVTATEILQALNVAPSDVKVGDVFTLYVLTTKDGLTTRSTAVLAINVTCQLDATLTTGDYKLVSVDWEVAGDVTLEADPNDPYKIYVDGYPEIEGLISNGNPIELNINPNSFKISGPASVVADEVSGYTNYTFTPLSGSYNSSDGSYTVTFAITVAQGSFGNFSFTFTRK